MLTENIVINYDDKKLYYSLLLLKNKIQLIFLILCVNYL